MVKFISYNLRNLKIMTNPPPANFKQKIISIFRNLPHDEQSLVAEFFNRKANGFYVDVGANEPIVESQTYHLEQMGWKGLLIEPLPHYCDLLKSHRNGQVVQVACSAPKNHNQILNLLVAGGHSTLNATPIAMGAQSQVYAEVTCKTLDSVLEENNIQPKFDFISIDIEGHEMEMFKGFSLRKWQPTLVLLEDHVVSHKKHRHMTSNGYQLIMRTGLNGWYVSKNQGYKLSLFAYLQYLRKYYLGLHLRKFRYMR